MSKVGLSKSELDTPFLWVDLDRLERNITYLAEYFKRAGVNWRPHVKGIKIPAIAQRAIGCGAIGVTCATLGEAEIMAAAGIQDILIANQIVGPGKIARLSRLRHHADVKVAVDSIQNGAELAAEARSNGVELGVLVEVDTGMGRAGMAPGRPAVDLAHRLQSTPGLRFLGLMAWEGHTRAIPEMELRREAIQNSVRLLTKSAQECRTAGLPVHIVSGGGSGTYYVTAHEPGITEIQAGGAIFCDVLCQSWGVETEPSLFVRALVTSRPEADRVILDAGFKTLPGWKAEPRPLGLSGVKGMHFSAEHATLTLDGRHTAPKVGDAIDFVVGYGDATLFLHDRLVGIRKDVVEVVWSIQGRGRIW